ncbi:hypothetical protein HZU40_33890 (plasmid) [Mycolicibacterium fluoranthenivorans]|uniref:Uncharacterized protein n=1 Tax=Mycolicibacterium fluoranthenivorans TaxID=258505 RepID=A0A7G8PQB0_9MYCO|nr:hypothetical protein [Mycolicibacterium fluoranthenivorans]QNJ96526.1 hypothetical protein HZU40_33890 [Mycolicibacterium fluoranthenivorans]
MMSDTSMLLLAAGETLSSPGGSGGVPSVALMLIAGLVLPLMSIAFAVMLPLRSARSSRDDASALGLGDRSLEEEFWDFIDDVERGRVTLSEVKVTAELGAAASLPGEDADERQADGA